VTCSRPERHPLGVAGDEPCRSPGRTEFASRSEVGAGGSAPRLSRAGDLSHFVDERARRAPRSPSRLPQPSLNRRPKEVMSPVARDSNDSKTAAMAACPEELEPGLAVNGTELEGR
jgi:hypothetical protein